jgi:hypothetical protein
MGAAKRKATKREGADGRAEGGGEQRGERRVEIIPESGETVFP